MNEFVGIRRLILTQFRNHARLEIDTNAKVISLFGPNGAGKTNILEAISILGQGRGIRGAELKEMARMGENGSPFAVSALIGQGEEERRIGVGLDVSPNGIRKITRIDGKDVSQKQTLNTIRLIWVTPQMDRIFAGSQGERRRFLDRIVAGFMPEISSQMSAYEKLMRERQKLLEQENPDRIWLSTIEKDAAGTAIAIAQARIDAISALQAEILKREKSSFPQAKLILNGALEQALLEGKQHIEAEEKFVRKLHELRPLDAQIGRASFGTHKTEFSALHIPTNMEAAKCSTGEQKALIIGLILAQARLVANGLSYGLEGCFNKPNPLIILDEAQAHFDIKRRDALAEELLEIRGQSWLSGTDKSLFDAFGNNGDIFSISASCAEKII